MPTLPRIDQPSPPRRLTRTQQRVVGEHAFAQLLDRAEVGLALSAARAAEQRKHRGGG